MHIPIYIKCNHWFIRENSDRWYHFMRSTRINSDLGYSFKAKLIALTRLQPIDKYPSTQRNKRIIAYGLSRLPMWNVSRSVGPSHYFSLR